MSRGGRVRYAETEASEDDDLRAGDDRDGKRDDPESIGIAFSHPALQSHAVALAYRYFAAEFVFEFVRQRECLGQGAVPGANVDDGE